jgi:serine incorporator 1/3
LQAKNGSLFPAAILTLYCTYLCYSALTSEPHDYPCNGLGHKLNAASASTLATGMALALLSVVYSALRAGSNTKLFGFGAEEPDDAHAEPLIETEEGTSAGLDGEAKFTGRVLLLLVLKYHLE